MTEANGVHLSLDQLRDLCRDVLSRNGLASPHVEAVAETLVAGERDACGAHGAYRLLVAVHSLRSGKVNPVARPRLTAERGAVVRVDADGGFAQCAFETGRPTFIEKVRAQGVAALAINRSVHFAALWPEVEALARDGLVAFAFTSNHAWVAPHGGTTPLFGTNPLAFGWPRPRQEPLVFDFSTSASSRGDIELARRAGEQVPEGWGIDHEGAPTTDPEKIVTGGAMLPFGGHKGGALSLMVELLAGPLIGDLTSEQSLRHDAGAAGSPFGGELILGLSPEKLAGARWADHMQNADALLDSIIGQGARLPAQRRYQARRRSLENGVVLSKTLYEELRAL